MRCVAVLIFGFLCHGYMLNECAYEITFYEPIGFWTFIERMREETYSSSIEKEQGLFHRNKTDKNRNINIS